MLKNTAKQSVVKTRWMSGSVNCANHVWEEISDVDTAATEYSRDKRETGCGHTVWEGVRPTLTGLTGQSSGPGDTCVAG